jgi:hypothetical protein
MRINLQVSFEDKDLAKRRGALWDPNKRVWYIVDQPDLTLFERWIPQRLLQPVQHKAWEHPEFVVTAPRTPKKVNTRAKFR